MAQALTTLSSQTSRESDAHTVAASALLNDIVMPMKNLAEAQSKERKSVIILWQLISCVRCRVLIDRRWFE